MMTNRLDYTVMWRCCWVLACALVLGGQDALGQDSVCARVVIEIAQQLTLERQAFDAHMRINNGLGHLTMRDVDITLNFQDDEGNEVFGTSNPRDTTATFFCQGGWVEQYSRYRRSRQGRTLEFIGHSLADHSRSRSRGRIGQRRPILRWGDIAIYVGGRRACDHGGAG